jgi:hypothetical protein
MISTHPSHPEYGEKFMRSNFTKITRYDYLGKSPKDNPLRHQGVHLIFYDDQIDMEIKVICTEKEILFRIGNEYSTLMRTSIPTDQISESHYRYFEKCIDTFYETQNRRKEVFRNFKTELPIDFVRDHKLKQII